MNNFLPESGKSRAERALNFLTFVLKHDEYVIELENVLRQNNMGVLIPEEEMEEESVVSGKNIIIKFCSPGAHNIKGI